VNLSSPRRRWLTGGTIGLMFVAGGLALAAPAISPLKVGAAAPAFALRDQSGKMHRLSDYRGHTVVLAFYPKDFTFG